MNLNNQNQPKPNIIPTPAVEDLSQHLIRMARPGTEMSQFYGNFARPREPIGSNLLTGLINRI